MKLHILFTLFLTSLCVCSYGKDLFESPNHQLNAELNGQSLTVYDKNRQMVTRIHLGLITDRGNLDSDLVLKQSTAPKAVKADYTMVTGKRIHCHNRAARLADGTIAGSATNLYDCMCNAVSFGIPLEDAIRAATWNPAHQIGALDRVGSIRAGKLADFVVADDHLNRLAVYLGGNKL